MAEFAFGKLTPEQIERSNKYPEQHDPEYWSKVPALFEEEFAVPGALEAFRANWIVYRVPLALGDATVTNPYIQDIYDLLTKHIPNEDDRRPWFELLKEPVTGHTVETHARLTRNVNIGGIDIPNSGFLRPIKLHHILKYQIETGRKIADYDCIVEFGGGMGEFARLARDVGFKGTYYGIDFKPMCRINEFYNKDLGENIYMQHSGDLPDLKGKKVLATGQWSISESPFKVRWDLVMSLPKSDWLVAFQTEVFGMDNLNYFIKEFPGLTGRDFKYYLIPWHSFQGGNFYAFGINHFGE